MLTQMSHAIAIFCAWVLLVFYMPLSRQLDRLISNSCARFYRVCRSFPILFCKVYITICISFELALSLLSEHFC